MSSTSLELFLAIPMPSIEVLERPEDKELSRSALYATLDELCEASGSLAFHFEGAIYKPDIDVLDSPARRMASEQGLFPEERLKGCEIMRVAAAVPLPNPGGLDLSDLDPSKQEAALQVLAELYLSKQVSNLLLMANIARLGSIELRDSVLVSDAEQRDFSHIPNMEGYALQCAARLACRIGWPPLHPLHITAAWEWATNRIQMFEGFDATPMGRALSAFSRIFEAKTADEPMQMLWALVGLESLYGAGKVDLLQQVRDKSQVLLGKQQQYKSVISRMYDCRSRFVHGDLDFPPLFLVADARESVARYDNQLSEATATAVAVLCATLQEVVRRGWNGLHFEYSVSERQ